MRGISLIPLACLTWVSAIVGTAVGPVGVLICVVPGLVMLMVPERRIRIHGGAILIAGLLLLVPLGALHTARDALDAAHTSRSDIQVDVVLDGKPRESRHSSRDTTLWGKATSLSNSATVGRREVTLPAGTGIVVGIGKNTRAEGHKAAAVAVQGAQLRVRGSWERSGDTLFVTASGIEPLRERSGSAARASSDGQREDLTTEKPQRTEDGAIREQPTNFFSVLRDTVRKKFSDATQFLPLNEAALVRGFVIGDAEGLDSNTKDAMRTSGLTHLVAASGANIALSYAFVALPLLYAGMRRKPRVICGAAAIGAYVFLVGPEP